MVSGLLSLSFFSGTRIVIFDIFAGHLQSKLVYYLMNIHTQPRCIYLCRVSLPCPCNYTVSLSSWTLAGICTMCSSKIQLDRLAYSILDNKNYLFSMEKVFATCLEGLEVMLICQTEEKRYCVACVICGFEISLAKKNIKKTTLPGFEPGIP